MLHISSFNENDELNQLALLLEADLIEEYNSTKLSFDNSNGQGYITTYQVLPGLTAEVYNLKLKKELCVKKVKSEKRSSYFLYCVKGYYFLRLLNEKDFQKISRNKNVILTSGFGEDYEMILPPEIDLQISVIELSRNTLEKVESKKARKLEQRLIDLATTLSNKENDKHFDRIDIETSEYAKVLINNKRVDTIGLLITEGAVLNTLASQLSNHRKHKNETLIKPLRTDELEKIIALGDFIKSNINRPIVVEELSKYSGLNPKKLQKGTNYLYGESVGSLIQRLRLEKARELFIKTDLSISEVTYSVGISSRSYFSKIFHNEFGLHPSEFRKNLNNKNLVFELSYRSKAIENITDFDIENILKVSIRNNEKHKITGALVFFKNTFFQIVEGSKGDILELYDKLLIDKRHHEIQIIYRGIKTKRTFKSWSMAFITDNKNYESKYLEGKLSFVDLEPIMKDMDNYEVFSDILWRRVRTILKISA